MSIFLYVKYTFLVKYIVSSYFRCEEFWEPQLDGLERLVVNREIPIIHILLSIDPVDISEPG